MPLGDTGVVVPGELLDIFKEELAVTESILENMSDAQKAKINEEFNKDPDAFLETPQFEAMVADVKLFGHAAFRREDRQ